MAVGLAELVITCLVVDWLFRQCRLPGLVGMLFVGILFGPYVLNLVEPELAQISSDLRLIALIVILLRAGLELSRDVLNRVGIRVLLLSCVPAVFETAAITVLGPIFLHLTYLESAMLGAILGAVSPAVVVPLMIDLIERHKGAEKGIPTLVLAASAIDDVFVIVIYSVFLGIYTGQHVNLVWEVAGIPVSILLGCVVGLIVGYLLFRLFERFNPRATKRGLIVLGIAIILVHTEHEVAAYIPFASLLAVMAIGFIILEKNEHMAHELSAKFSKIWVLAEIILFTMVGGQVNISVAMDTGLNGVALILLGLAARSLGTALCLIGSDLNSRERWFVVVAYLPKATVQAAIGAGPLMAMTAIGFDTHPGEVILASAVLSILLTAPLGAWAITVTGERFLETAAPGRDESLEAARESLAHGEDII